MTIAAAGCSPLRSTRSERHETLTITDSTLTMLFRQQFERQIGTLRVVLPPSKILAVSASRQSVKRISYTKVSMQNDRTLLTDSISHSRINTVTRNDAQQQPDEQHSSGFAWLEQATALVILTLLLLLFLKLR